VQDTLSPRESIAQRVLGRSCDAAFKGRWVDSFDDTSKTLVGSEAHERQHTVGCLPRLAGEPAPDLRERPCGVRLSLAKREEAGFSTRDRGLDGDPQQLRSGP
jgi:hypothetical protein